MKQVPCPTHLLLFFQKLRWVLAFSEILFLVLVSVTARAQQLTGPLPQPPFRWQDFDVQKQYTILKVNRQVIDSATVRPFFQKPNKGMVRQRFSNAVLSGQPRVYPFDYQYQVQFSPDKRYYLVYRYDYSQPELWVHCQILNADFSVRQSFQWMIDDGTTSHGYWLDNQGDVYAVYTDAEDAVYVMRYHPATQTSDWLEIGSDVTRRNRFVPVLGAPGILFLANVSEDANSHWKGVMFTIFDFQHEEIKDLYFYPAENIQEKLGKNMPDGRYEIIDFTVANQEKTVVLQKVAIHANRYIYDPFAYQNPSLWVARKQQVQYGEKITLTLNAENKVIQQKIEAVFLTKE